MNPKKPNKPTKYAPRKRRHTPAQIEAATADTVAFFKHPDRLAQFDEEVGAAKWRMMAQAAVGEIAFGRDGYRFSDPSSLNERKISELTELADVGDADADQAVRDMAIELIERGAPLVGGLREYAINRLRAAQRSKKPGKGPHENSTRDRLIAFRVYQLMRRGFPAERTGLYGTSASEIVSDALDRILIELHREGIKHKARTISAGAVATIWHRLKKTL
jgi:hypothetical protein